MLASSYVVGHARANGRIGFGARLTGSRLHGEEKHVHVAGDAVGSVVDGGVA